jgi:hypothetical protein
MMGRYLHNEEKLLITSMVRGLTVENVILAELHDATVVDMNDGGMRGIRFCKRGATATMFGRQAVEATFVDGDGVPVCLTINLGQDDKLYELDIWKTDNSALTNYPQPEGVTIVRRSPSGAKVGR